MNLQNGCSLTKEQQQKVQEILDNHKDVESPLIPILHKIDEAFDHHLPIDVAKMISCKLDIPLSKIYGVVTFYSLFSTKPRGKHIIRICESPACHLVGADDIIDVAQKHLGINVGETTEDGLFTLEKTACLGICGVAPAMMIDNDVYGNLTVEKVVEIFKSYKK